MDCWTRLGVPETATTDEVKAAYRRLAHDAHPDKGGSTAAFFELNIAYKLALSLSEQPLPCPECRGIGYVQVPTSLFVVTCPGCKGTCKIPRGGR